MMLIARVMELQQFGQQEQLLPEDEEDELSIVFFAGLDVEPTSLGSTSTSFAGGRCCPHRTG
jgi:hypothetical protein